jgi:hypothetical protein
MNFESNKIEIVIYVIIYCKASIFGLVGIWSWYLFVCKK